MNLPPHILDQDYYLIQVRGRGLVDIYSIENHIEDDVTENNVVPLARSHIQTIDYSIDLYGQILTRGYSPNAKPFPYYFKCNTDTLAFFVQELKNKNLLICCHKKENSAYCYGNTCNVNDLRSY